MQGITYWVIEDSLGIRLFVDTAIRREWEADARSAPGPAYDDAWLPQLAARGWRLTTLRLDRIRLNPRLMAYLDRHTGASFAAELKRRSRELHRAIQEYGAVIWPVVVRGEDLQLMDGYCRYTVLRQLGVDRVYAYVGRLVPRRSNMKRHSRG